MSARARTTPIRAALAVACVIVAPRPAAAQTGVPTDNAFAIDLYQGPILASSRVVSMGGASTGHAQGIGAFPINAGAPAVRHTHSTRWLEVDVDASLSFPLVLSRQDDFDNSGDRDANYQSYVYVAGGVNVQAGRLAVGAFGDVQRYDVRFGAGGEKTTVTVGRYHLLAGYQFFGGQFVVGGGVRAHSLAISAPGAALDTQLGMFGLAPQAGLVVKPDWAPFRIGATYRHAVGGLVRFPSTTTIDERGVKRAGGLIVPDDQRLPWEAAVGVAFQVGPRPLNPPWLDPDEHERALVANYEAERAERRRRRQKALAAMGEGPERAAVAARVAEEAKAEEARAAEELERDRGRLELERRSILANWPREFLLVTADLLVTGPVDRGVSLERFLGQAEPARDAPCQVVASGREVNFSPRFGLEIEPIPGWMRTRFGSYYEPTRFSYAPEPCNDRVGRQHFTFGAEVKAFKTTWFGLIDEVTYKVQAYGDLAPRYQNVGIGLGVWY